jgi:hypothetical protein
MQHERNDPVGGDFAEIWRSAQHRRIEDLRRWLTRIFKKSQQLESPDARTRRDWMLFRSLTLQARTFLPSRDSAGGSRKIHGIKGGSTG